MVKVSAMRCGSLESSLNQISLTAKITTSDPVAVPPIEPAGLRPEPGSSEEKELAPSAEPPTKPAEPRQDEPRSSKEREPVRGAELSTEPSGLRPDEPRSPEERERPPSKRNLNLLRDVLAGIQRFQRLLAARVSRRRR